MPASLLRSGEFQWWGSRKETPLEIGKLYFQKLEKVLTHSDRVKLVGTFGERLFI